MLSSIKKFCGFDSNCPKTNTTVDKDDSDFKNEKKTPPTKDNFKDTLDTYKNDACIDMFNLVSGLDSPSKKSGE